MAHMQNDQEIVDVNKLKAKNTILNNDITHFKALQVELSKKLEDMESKQEMYIDQIQQYKKQNTELKISSDANISNNQKDFLIHEIKQAHS